jgi:hypothetical protein
MGVFVACLLIGLIPAAIAHGKGRSFMGWWIFGSLLFIVALPWAICMKADLKTKDAEALSSGDFRKCPECAELVRAEARKCKHCGSILEPSA